MTKRTRVPSPMRAAVEALRAEERGEITRERRQQILTQIAEQLSDELELPFENEGGDAD